MWARVIALYSRIRFALARRRLEEETRDEIDTHLDLLVDRYIRSGLTPEEAYVRARRQFGNVTRLRQDIYEMNGIRFVDGVTQDLRIAVRMLRAAPIVTGMAILSLALGIGANTAIFSLVDSLLLRTLPVPEPERLVLLASTGTPTSRRTAWSYGLWEEIRQRATQMCDGAVAWSATGTGMDRLNLSAAGGEVQAVDGAYVSGDFFTTLGVPAVLGRTFTSADDVRGGGPDGPVSVISICRRAMVYGRPSTYQWRNALLEGRRL
jgi:hypothetical protein